MIIKNPDVLKGWLAVILEPLCDADPSALARYVFALLKKEKTIKELKRSMIEQLDVFLADETKPFVERLFSAINSEEYLLPITSASSAETPAKLEIPLKSETPLKTETDNVNKTQSDRECTPPLDKNSFDTKDFEKKFVKATPSSVESCNYASSHEMFQTPSSTVVISPISNTLSVSPVKTIADKENHPRENRNKRRLSAKSKSRSRSRSNGSRRSTSRERRINEREKQSKLHRNKSPPPEKRRMERRNVQDRIDRSGLSKNRNRSPSLSRSRSNSPDRRRNSVPNSPTIKDTKRQRCRDFDEKGYCVRGETCPWDHGINPVVLEGISNPALLTMPPHLREYNPDAPEIWNRGAIGGAFAGGPRPNFPSHKNGSNSGNGPATAYPRPPGSVSVGFRPNSAGFPFVVNPVSQLQRELISVPTVDAKSSNNDNHVTGIQSKRRYEMEDSSGLEAPNKRKLPINSRLGPRIGPSGAQQNCSLELRKIPRGMNTIAHLNNHFSKFGKITNIQITYDGDPEAAIVTFSTHAEANVAYRSTEAVLNNRFIKVFWHSDSSNNANNPISKDELISNGRKSSQYHISNLPTTSINNTSITNTLVNESSKVSGESSTLENTSSTSVTKPNTGTATTTVSSTPLSATTIQPSMRLKNNRPLVTNAVIRKKQEEQAKAVVQLANGLRKRKGELLNEYLKEMKTLVDHLGRLDQNDSQRPSMMDTVKNLQANIDKLRKELTTEQAQIAAQIKTQPIKKSKEQQKKELLDIELELITQQQEGNDTTAIQKRLEDLQRNLGITNQKSFSSSRLNHRIRVAPPLGSTSVDRRPKTILITGFSSEDCDLLLGHFKHFGEISKHEIDKSVPHMLITFSNRSIAEQAAVRGKMFKDKQLKISWVLPTLVIPQNKPQIQKPTEANTDVVNEKPEFNVDSEKLPELRLEDDEEDEEERSWRK